MKTIPKENEINETEINNLLHTNPRAVVGGVVGVGVEESFEDNNLIINQSTDQSIINFKEKETKQNNFKFKFYLLIAIVVFILLILFLTLLVFHLEVFDRDTDEIEDCITPYGTRLGSDEKGVIGYSNCNEFTISDEPNFIPYSNTSTNKDDFIYSGMKWQCVEYSRRWLISTLQVTFSSVGYAYQIFDLSTVTNIFNESQTYPFHSYLNNESITSPQLGCLIIYNHTEDIGPAGHVAVITGIEKNLLLLGEQNWSNNYWEGINYSRNLTVTNIEGKYSINDESLIGWKCVEK